MQGDKITQWISEFTSGDQQAAERIFQQYNARLVRLAQKKLVSLPPQVADGEGAAISAFRSFFSGVKKGQFPRLDDRDDLWKVLATITMRKAVAQLRRHHKKSGEGGKVDRDAEIDGVLHAEPTPAQVAELLEECERKIACLCDETLKQIALWKLQGYDSREIAEKLDVHQRTVQRKLAIIQDEWSSATEE